MRSSGRTAVMPLAASGTAISMRRDREMPVRSSLAGISQTAAAFSCAYGRCWGEGSDAPAGSS